MGRGGVNVALGPVVGHIGEGLTGDGNRLPAKNTTQDGDKSGPGHILAYAETAIGIALHETVDTGLFHNGGGPGVFGVCIAVGHRREGGRQKGGHEQGDKTAFEVHVTAFFHQIEDRADFSHSIAEKKSKNNDKPCFLAKGPVKCQKKEARA